MKNKSQIIKDLAQTDEDRVLLANALDRLETTRTRGYPSHTRFLSPREHALVQQAAERAGSGVQTSFCGGYPEAERMIAVFSPEYEEEAPLKFLRAQVKGASLTHRDCLGSLMGLQIERALIGDILINGAEADLIVLPEAVDFLLTHLTHIGRQPVSLWEIAASDLRPPVESGEERSCSVASLRLDCVTAQLFGLSRAAAQTAVAHGLVTVNGLPCSKAEKAVTAGDRITLRGKGRARISTLSGVSRKGRQFVQYIRSN